MHSIVLVCLKKRNFFNSTVNFLYQFLCLAYTVLFPKEQPAVEITGSTFEIKKKKKLGLSLFSLSENFSPRDFRSVLSIWGDFPFIRFLCILVICCSNINTEPSANQWMFVFFFTFSSFVQVIIENDFYTVGKLLSFK